MLDIWRPIDHGLVTGIATYQKESCFEHIDTDRITADQANICPFIGYCFIRLKYSAQRISVNQPGRSPRRHELTDGTVSYLLVKSDDNNCVSEVIPLHSNAASLYAINKQLGLKLTQDTVASYLVFFGLVIRGSEGSFYFVTKWNYLKSVLERLPESSRAILEGLYRASFTIRDNDNPDLQIKEISYPILGKAFTLSVLCVYAGRAYKANIRISESGVPTMDEDHPTTIRGLDDSVPITKPYELEFSPNLRSVISKSKNRLQSGIQSLTIALLSEKAISFLLLPAYFMSLLIVFYAGFTNKQIHQYYEFLKSLQLVNWTAALLGTPLVIGLITRFVVIEIGALTQQCVPGVWEKFFSQMTNGIQKSYETLGFVRFAIFVAVELVCISLLGINLLIYGISNTFPLATASTGMNFVETFILIILSFPIVGSFLKWIFGIEKKLGLYEVYQDDFLIYFSSFLMTTITFGLFIRLFRLARQSS